MFWWSLEIFSLLKSSFQWETQGNDEIFRFWYAKPDERPFNMGIVKPTGAPGREIQRIPKQTFYDLFSKAKGT